MKIGPLDPEVIGLQGINDNRRILHRVSICPLVNSKVTGTKLTAFSHDVSAPSPLLTHASALRYSNSFETPVYRVKVVSVRCIFDV